MRASGKQVQGVPYCTFSDKTEEATLAKPPLPLAQAKASAEIFPAKPVLWLTLLNTLSLSGLGFRDSCFFVGSYYKHVEVPTKCRLQYLGLGLLKALIIQDRV